MQDAFISCSSRDAIYIDEVCKLLKKEGIEYWIYSRIDNLGPGKDYTTEIGKAMDESRMFIILLSDNSIESEQVKQESIMANERQRYGMKIFPVIVGSLQNEELLKERFEYVLAGKQKFRWNDKNARKAFVEQIRTYLEDSSLRDEEAVIGSNWPVFGKLIGRDEEIKQISEGIKKHHRLMVTGVGGIGKTALLQAFCNCESVRSVYKSIIYLSYDGSLLREIDDDARFPVKSSKLADGKSRMSNYVYALSKLSVFENIVGEDVLLIIDNFDSANDPLFERICRLKCDLIIANRFSENGFSKFKRIHIGPIRQEEARRELFEMHYGSALEKSEIDPFRRICASLHSHTMALILVARQMSYFGRKPGDYRDLTEVQTERTRSLIQMLAGGDEDTGVMKAYAQLLNMYDPAMLSETERTVMKTMCLLPSEGISQNVYMSLVGDDCAETVTNLNRTGWLQIDLNENTVYILPLIRDVVMKTYDLTMVDPDISHFMERFFKRISDSWTASYTENVKYKQLAFSVYFLFPTPTTRTYKDYIELSRFMWVLNFMDIGIEIQNKVKALFKDTPNSLEEAEVCLQIGYIYNAKGEFAMAEDEFIQAAKVYGNKYASAISHLAQSKMENEGAKLSDVEPLVKESLSVRQKYWAGTMFEAISCHLYAKTLSRFGKKLDRAIEMEKKAYQIMKKKDPNGVDLSSASYILGWLYVQAARDEKDVDHGIRLLEEAKDIRLRKRGEEHHAWMEDIYLKLALAYKTRGDLETAQRYAEMLLKVREKKYADADEKRIIRAYELLREIYVLLDNREGVEICDAYLRYHG